MFGQNKISASGVARFTFLLIASILFAFGINNALAANKITKNNASQSKIRALVPESKNTTQTKSLIVRFKKEAADSIKSRLHQSLSTRVKKKFKMQPGLQVIEVGADKDFNKVLTAYQKDPNVLFAEPDFKIKLRAVPNDTSFSQMWGLRNVGQTGGVNDADINAPEAWDITTGDPDVVVAVIDSGVDYSHADLSVNMWVNPNEIPGNGIDDDGNGYTDDIYGIDPADNDSNPMDDDGHGTHVAGTIGARGNNNFGVTGINWDVKIIACKIFATTVDQSQEAFVSDAIACLEYLYDLKMNHGVNIVASNNSWGWIGPSSQALKGAISLQLNAGILFVAAAGNEDLNIDRYQDNPSGYYIPNVISVAATDHNDTLSYFSNRGERTVHVAAPGESILSTVPGGYELLDGTSMASPHVAGLAALLKAQTPARTWHEIKNLIVSSGTPLDALSNTTVSGRRIRAADDDGTGALNCSNQTVLSRLRPALDGYEIESGRPANISMLHINCGEPAGDVSVTIAETGTTVTLLDNGQEFDQVAGDGIYSARIDLVAEGIENATLEFPDASNVQLSTIHNYLPAEPVTYQWRDISGSGQPVFTEGAPPYDDGTSYIDTPFPISFGNVSTPYNRLAIDTNGYIVMQRAVDPPLGFSVYQNFEMPIDGVPSLVAVFWDDLVADTGNDVVWGVQGSAPNRELIVTWQNVRPYGEAPGLTFQVVFFENSSDVVFNYQDTEVVDTFTTNGAGATSGVQVLEEIGRQHSYNSPVLTNSTSLRWAMPPGSINDPFSPPSAYAGEDQYVLEGDRVSLVGSGTDSNGSIASYRWRQVSGRNVLLNNASSLTTSFTAPQVTTVESLVFELIVTDDENNTDTDRVSVLVFNSSQSETPSIRQTPGGGGGSTGFISLILMALIITGRQLHNKYKKN